MQKLFERVPGFWTPHHLSQSLCRKETSSVPYPSHWMDGPKVRGASYPERLLSERLSKVYIDCGFVLLNLN